MTRGAAREDRTCNRCGVALELGVNWTEGQARHYSYVCRACNSAKGIAHYKANRDRANQRQRARRRDPIMGPKARATSATWYERNKDRWKVYHETSRQKDRTSPWHRAGRLLTWSRSRAARKGLAFDLDREWLEVRLAAGICEVTGLPFDFSPVGNLHCRPFSPSLDRRDSRQGYTKENCQIVVWIYNMAKGEWTHGDVVRLAAALLEKEKA